MLIACKYDEIDIFSIMLGYKIRVCIWAASYVTYILKSIRYGWKEGKKTIKIKKGLNIFV